MSMKEMLLLQAAAAFGAVYDDLYNPYHQERIRRSNEQARKRREGASRRMAERELQNIRARQLRKFTIKGHDIEAYSRKDAIVKLKHKGLL